MLWEAINLNPGQTIATCQRNMLCAFGHRVAICWVFDHFQTWANNTQHVTTHRNTVAKRTMLRLTMLRYVALACCDRLTGALENIVGHQNSRFISFRNRPAKCLSATSVTSFFLSSTTCSPLCTVTPLLVLQFILYLSLRNSRAGWRLSWRHRFRNVLLSKWFPSTLEVAHNSF